MVEVKMLLDDGAIFMVAENLRDPQLGFGKERKVHMEGKVIRVFAESARLAEGKLNNFRAGWLAGRESVACDRRVNGRVV